MILVSGCAGDADPPSLLLLPVGELEDDSEFSFELSDDEDDGEEREGRTHEENGDGTLRDKAFYENGDNQTDPESDSSAESLQRRRRRRENAHDQRVKKASGEGQGSLSNIEAQTQRLVERMQQLHMLS